MSKLFQKMDSDENGSVSFNETKDWISELDRKKRIEIAMEKFGEYDLDGDNLVSLEEYLDRLGQARFWTLTVICFVSSSLPVYDNQYLHSLHYFTCPNQRKSHSTKK